LSTQAIRKSKFLSIPQVDIYMQLIVVPDVFVAFVPIGENSYEAPI